MATFRRGVVVVGIVCVFVPLLSINLAADDPPAGGEEDRPVAQEHRLVSRGPGAGGRGPVVLGAGDMLQITPFKYPLVPEFLGSKLSVKSEGDPRAMEFIGQTYLPVDKEGPSAATAFLYARAKGQTTLTVTLVNSHAEPIEGFRATYTVQIK